MCIDCQLLVRICCHYFLSIRNQFRLGFWCCPVFDCSCHGEICCLKVISLNDEEKYKTLSIHNNWTNEQLILPLFFFFFFFSFFWIRTKLFYIYFCNICQGTKNSIFCDSIFSSDEQQHYTTNKKYYCEFICIYFFF